MASNESPRVYDFESQLELGELMLSLGRIKEAASELKKARELNDIGAYSTPDDDPKRQDDLQRLQIALDRVEDLQDETSGYNKIWTYVGLAALIGTIGVIFGSWMLNRAALLDVKAVSTEQAVLLELRSTELAAVTFQDSSEGTRVADQITELYQELSEKKYQATQISDYAEQSARNAQLALTAAAQSIERAESNPQVEVRQVVVTATPDPFATQSTAPVADAGQGGGGTAGEASPTPRPQSVSAPASDGEMSNRLRITNIAANLRRGPGFNYIVLDTLQQDEVMDLVSQSQDSYWYNVATDDGRVGWVHSSLAKPTSLDWLPVEGNVPRPLTVPTAVPSNTPIPPTRVPATAVPPTAVPPTKAPPTQVPASPVPPTQAPVVQATQAPPTAVPPTAAPPTQVPASPVPPTQAPVVQPTQAPPTAVPPTAAPPTQAPVVQPTQAPATAVPPTAVPATQAPVVQPTQPPVAATPEALLPPPEPTVVQSTESSGSSIGVVATQTLVNATLEASTPSP